MNRIAACLLMIAASGTSAYAANGAGQEKARQLDVDPTAARGSRADAGDSAVTKVTDYVGKDVVNIREEKIGEILDLAIDGSRGRVVYAVLAAGGWLGIGQELYAVPIGALRPAAGGDVLKFATSRARFDEQQAFDAERWPMEANPALVEKTPADASPRSGRLEALPTDSGNQTGR